MKNKISKISRGNPTYCLTYYFLNPIDFLINQHKTYEDY